MQQEEKTKIGKFVPYHANMPIFVIKTEFLKAYALGNKITVLATLS